KLCTHNLKLIDEARHLQIKNANKNISLVKSKVENDIKSKKIRSLESMIKILKVELENLKNELESKINKLEYLKSEAILKPIVGRNDEKNITKSDNISLGSTDLSKYFVHRKNMNPKEKINGKITELPKNETSISNISKNNMPIKPNVLQIISENVTPHLAQRDNNISSLIELEAMRPSLKALPLPVVASTLMTPLSAYMLLTLLIIAVI
ncbi:17227_t:CDS:2, partial [Funneliformis caledonium]